MLVASFSGLFCSITHLHDYKCQPASLMNTQQFFCLFFSIRPPSGLLPVLGHWKQYMTPTLWAAGGWPCRHGGLGQAGLHLGHKHGSAVASADWSRWWVDPHCRSPVLEAGSDVIKGLYIQAVGFQGEHSLCVCVSGSSGNKAKGQSCKTCDIVGQFKLKLLKAYRGAPYVHFILKTELHVHQYTHTGCSISTFLCSFTTQDTNGIFLNMRAIGMAPT